MARRVLLPLGPVALASLVLAAGCSGSGSGASPGAAGRSGPADAAAVEPPVVVEVRPLGKASLDEYGWRRGPGKEAFDRALAAEKKGDLAAVARACEAALAADPGHLEAAWMLAVARVRQGQLDQVLTPLAVAAAGDWGKWGERSLTLPVLEPFRTTAAGRGWVKAAEGHRAALTTALADAALVVARTEPPRGPRGSGDVEVDQRAEVYAVGGGRWIRLTRTGGAVVAALTAPGRGAVAYVAYRTLTRPREGRGRIRALRIGVVDLATGLTGRELVLSDVTQVTLAWATGKGEPELVAEVVPVQGKAQVITIDGDHGARQPRVGGLPRAAEALRVRPLAAERRRLGTPGLTADWDDAGTASAVRLDRSRKIVAPPAGAMIDGHSLAWSPDQARLAFASVAEDPCGEGAARAVTLYVADAGSGRLRPVATGERVPSPVWLAPTRLAFVDGDAVRVFDVVAGKDVARLAGGAGVTTGVLGELRPCAADEAAPFAPVAAEPDDEPADDPELDELGPVDGAAGPVDAGASDAARAP